MKTWISLNNIACVCSHSEDLTRLLICWSESFGTGDSFGEIGSKRTLT